MRGKERGTFLILLSPVVVVELNSKEEDDTDEHIVHRKHLKLNRLDPKG